MNHDDKDREDREVMYGLYCVAGLFVFGLMFGWLACFWYVMQTRPC